ncbi:RNA 2'-phosphotransferase [Mesobaculum littorinae]|uniref:Probable RNA 2'-phosphotransferase n=1 Tax=Mesobaculum littorinae TaxID=2486419 RepID=A0A438AGT3_9RHOB|nr:RNA 2'-phosphotransferase [Mesobaculum littorinae]RVV97926.1 RNA 2'-phosphotransferase [Mesobaculum littorinae]
MSRESKFLSRVLRHEPGLIGLKIEKGGWVRVEELLRKMKAVGQRMTRERLEEIVRDNDKQRFTIRDGKIRAAQGHSINVDLELPVLVPSPYLYHGTAAQSLDEIFAEGLYPGSRRQVHLSHEVEIAVRVGRRHGKPVVLRVDAEAMHTDGHLFFRADNGVWLTDRVPAGYLGFGVP